MFFFKRGAFGGSIIKKGVISAFEKVKYITFQTKGRGGGLNFCPTPKI